MEIAVGVYYPIALAIGAIVSWYIVGLYITTQKKWWNSISQLVIIMPISLGLIFTWVFIARVWPTVPGRIVISMILFSLVVCALLWVAWTLTKLFRVLKKERNNERFFKKD